MRITDDEMAQIRIDFPPFACQLKKKGLDHLILEPLLNSNPIETEIFGYLERRRYHDASNDTVYFPLCAYQSIFENPGGINDSLLCYINYSGSKKFHIENIDYYRITANMECTTVSYQMKADEYITLTQLQKIVEKADNHRKKHHLKDYELVINGKKKWSKKITK